MAPPSGKPSTKFILFIGLFFSLSGLAIAILIIGPSLHRFLIERNLRQTGLPATATIISLTDTGSRINALPVMMISLSVTTPDGKTFPSSTQETVSPAAYATLQPGATVNIRYNPADTHLVAITSPSP